MKVGLIIDFEIEPTKGGGYNYTHLFLTNIIGANSNHDFVVITPYAKEKIIGAYNLPITIQIIDLKKIERKPFFLVLRLLSILFKKTGVFHNILLTLEKRKRKAYTRFFIKYDLQCLYYLPYNKFYTSQIPFFYTVWDIGHKTISYLPEMAEERHFTFWNNLYNDILPRAYKIVCESEAGKKDIEFYYRIKTERIIVAPMFAGDVINEKSSAEEASLFLKNHGLIKNQYLYYPAQFWAHKNHINLIKALQIVRQNNNFPLKLVLSGSNKGNLDYIKNIVHDLGLEQVVLFPGFITNKQTYILYQNALALTMPTFLGPTNMPIIEALAIGCPVICTDSEGHREQAKDAALYISPENPSEMAKAITTIYTNETLRNKLVATGIKVYETSPNTIGEICKRLLTEIDKFESIRSCWGNTL